MTPSALTVAFVALVTASLALQLWLARRHALHVASHRDAVPAAFADRVRLPAHQKAADYTVARTRLGMVEATVETVLLLALTVGGGLAALVAWTSDLPLPGLARDLALIVAVALIAGIVGLPLSYASTFGTEAKFGFNRMTRALWLADLAKGVAVGAALGLPLAALVLWLMAAAGTLWWIWAWVAWVTFQLLVLALYPTVIAPLFNRFSPLPAGSARDAIERLLARCGFENKGLYVMDGSKRSAHGNAFFTGFGRAKRIVFFDTLLERLAPDEIEAVLAHELGHFRLKHVLKRMLWSAALSLGFLALLAWLAASAWFYEGLGVPPAPDRPGVALILFFLALPAFTFVFAPLSALYSRRHEFEADAFAAQHASAASLVRALVKLFEDNAATLTPDPYYSAFHDSHPPAALRVARLEGA
ncbi:MAG TPA: M48 family metallopeptidase [Casimicrobiaceae bacterium]|nr:M48 family metallopeptidase [Casimicrobiaceae bacterium]